MKTHPEFRNLKVIEDGVVIATYTNGLRILARKGEKIKKEDLQKYPQFGDMKELKEALRGQGQVFV